jgi:hypothetical protein
MAVWGLMVAAAAAGETNMTIKVPGTYMVDVFGSTVVVSNEPSGWVWLERHWRMPEYNPWTRSPAVDEHGMVKFSEPSGGRSENTFSPGWFLFAEAPEYGEGSAVTNRLWIFDGKERLSFVLVECGNERPAIADVDLRSPHLQRMLKVIPGYTNGLAPFPKACPEELKQALPPSVLQKYFPAPADRGHSNDPQ